jgi:hypothetical protein
MNIVTALAAAGVVDCVLSLMVRRPNDTGLQEQACQVLECLAPTALQLPRREPEAYYARAGGGDTIPVTGPAMIRAVLSAMRRHAASDGVADRACNALSSIMTQCSTGACAAAVLGADGVAVIVSMMRRHAEVMYAQLAGCGALNDVACTSSENAAAVVQVAGGGVDVVLAAMQGHRECQDVQEHGSDTLSTLSYRDAGVVIPPAASGGVDAVLSSMRRDSDSVAAQERGCDVL